ncbi:hypothetical protein H6S82_28280, partial [Planktothrix sp. FACHB-1355]
MSPLSRSYITILEDNLERKAEMKRYLGEFFSTRSAIFFDNAPDAIAWLKECLQFCALISLDRDLGSSYWRDGEIFDPGTGRDVVDYLVAAKVQCPVIIHSSNYAEAGG